MRAAEHTEHTEQTWIYTPRHTRIEDRVRSAERQTERREHGSGIPSFPRARQQNPFIGTAHTDASSRAHGTHGTNTDSHGQTAWIVRCGTERQTVTLTDSKLKRETERQRACMNGCSLGAEKTKILSLKHTTQNTEPDRGLCPGHLRRSKRCVPHARQRGTGAERREHA